MKKLILLLSIFTFSFCSPSSEIIPYVNVNNIHEWSEEESGLLNLINAYRFNHSLNKLTPSKLNWSLASQRNADNVLINDISHLGYNKVIQSRKENGLHASAEMLGYRFSTIESMLNAWKRSDAHNKKLLEPEWIFVGIAIYRDDLTGSKYYCIILTY